MLWGNNQAIDDAIVAAVLAVVHTIQGARVGIRGTIELGGNGGDPFSKRLKALFDIRVVKFSRDRGPMTTFKWIVHTKRMVFMRDYMPTKRAYRG